ncbi:MAG: hypothetical protein AB1512_18945 [Thermodesulfobacteriota bacterium]
MGKSKKREIGVFRLASMPPSGRNTQGSMTMTNPVMMEEQATSAAAGKGKSPAQYDA